MIVFDIRGIPSRSFSLTCLCSNIPSTVVYLSQLIWYARACSVYDQFLNRGRFLTNRYFYCVVLSLFVCFVYGFTSRSRILHLYGDVTTAGEGLQNLGLCSALRAFEQGGIFIVPHLLWHGTSVFPVSFEGLPHLVASYDTHGDAEDLF
jgi:hypothetical protein